MRIDTQFDHEIAWLCQLSDWRERLEGEEFLESVKTDILVDRVFAYTPKGEIKDLPKDTTLDFAFQVRLRWYIGIK